ncbi:unnamed protein product [Protopolystoma xenopodis]|uniref:Uncharacterized protein n=1 Tax=Protopolystoma xenopodis TaxID=117903 RepID=A0A448X051_9PLAT|nr:unnamed protein product [Protopolystoma xenopodis]
MTRDSFKQRHFVALMRIHFAAVDGNSSKVHLHFGDHQVATFQLTSPDHELRSSENTAMSFVNMSSMDHLVEEGRQKVDFIVKGMNVNWDWGQ